MPKLWNTGKQCCGSGAGSYAVCFWAPPDPDPLLRGRYGFFCHQAKIVRKTLIPTVGFLYDFLSLKNDVNVASKSKKKKNLKKIIFCCRLEGHWLKKQDPEPVPDRNPDPLVGGTEPRIPDQYQNVTDPQHTAGKMGGPLIWRPQFLTKVRGSLIYKLPSSTKEGGRVIWIKTAAVVIRDRRCDIIHLLALTKERRTLDLTAAALDWGSWTLTNVSGQLWRR